jgi:acetolactate synthase-1/2/3 large subunit
MTGGEIVWASLARLGVTHVFGYPGGSILPTYDALPGSSIRHVLVRHEQGAAHMADGFARASGRVGVAIATSGPGATNLVTGIATAMMDSSPIVCITGQVNSGQIGLDAFQEVDITGITLPVTKHNYLVTEADAIAPALRDAFAIAASGRPGPVLVDITRDAQDETCAFAWDPAPVGRPPRATPAPGGDAVQAARELIAASERPIVLAGHGVLMADASGPLRAFAEAAGVPVAMTLLGLGAMPASHPLALGLVGLHGQPWVNHAVQEADLVIALGMRFADRVTGKPSAFAPRARRIHVDIDAAEINKIVKVDLGVVADVGAFLEAFAGDPGGAPGGRARAGSRAAWLARIASLRRESASRDILHAPDTGRLHAAHVMHDLWQATGGGVTIVSDVGQHQMWEAQYFPHERPRSLITSGGLGTMGFALPAAVGAQMARPGEEVWVVAGDGGFQMTMAELATVVQEGLPLKIAVINNGALGMVRQLQEVYCEKRYVATPIAGPDFCALAAAYGIPAARVEARRDVLPAIRAARERPGPALVEFRVETGDCVYPMVPAGAALHEMIRRPHPRGGLAPRAGGAGVPPAA